MLTARDMQILKFITEYGSITIDQCYKLFFHNAKYGHDMARKRLKALSDMGECKYTTLRNSTSLERIYYIAKPYSAHKLYLMDFYSNLVYAGADIIDFKLEAIISNLRSDAFVTFKYKDAKVIAFIEVVLTHQVDYSRYEALRDTQELQRQYGTFPMLIVISGVPDKYKGNKLLVKYLDYKLNDFNKIVLP